MQKKPLLEVKDLKLGFEVFGGLLEVLDEVNFTVDHEEKVALVGESGCGKSTFLRAITKNLNLSKVKISKGKILFNGKDILKMKIKEIDKLRGKEISMIFQDPTEALNPVFTIGYQMKAIIKYSSVRIDKNLTGTKIKSIIIEALKKVMLPDPERILGSYPFQLSGGMRQRICIAMALLGNVSLIIADELGTNLDVTVNDQILFLLNELVNKNRISIILVSHDLGVVKNIAERTYVMYAGSIVELAKTKELFKHPMHPYSKGLIAAIPRLTGEKMSDGIPGSLPNYLNLPRGCRFYPRCNSKMTICEFEKPPLIEIGESHKVACWLFDRERGKNGKQ